VRVVAAQIVSRKDNVITSVHGFSFKPFLTTVCELFGHFKHRPVVLLSETLSHLLNQLPGFHGASSTSFLLGLHLSGLLIPF
jgi:hypothetical protein